jgi:hypothetical protein
MSGVKIFRFFHGIFHRPEGPGSSKTFERDVLMLQPLNVGTFSVHGFDIFLCLVAQPDFRAFDRVDDAVGKIDGASEHVVFFNVHGTEMNCRSNMNQGMPGVLVEIDGILQRGLRGAERGQNTIANGFDLIP